MTPRIQSLHHVTATVNDAQEDLDFYARLLGQRLVKKTVNFDNHHVYHFYYGNEHGTPGTIMTTFPYKGMGIRQGVQGAGQVTATSFSVPASSLTFWHARLEHAGVNVDQRHAFNQEALAFRDPSGLMIQLVGNANDDRAPWVNPARDDIRPKYASRGIHGVTLLVRDPAKTISFLMDRMGATIVAEEGNTTRLSVGGDAPGHFVDVTLAHYAAPNAVNGLGTVHHVAFAIGTEEQLAIREELLQHGATVTEVRDREYFRSIYFREPGGVLYEIATLPPGFTVDEDLASLGTSLKLPPWEEPNRADIEAHLPKSDAPMTTALPPHGGQPVLSYGKPLGDGRAVVIMVHGRGAGPRNILELAPALSQPDNTYLAPGANTGTWYPLGFMSPIEQNEPGISSGISVIHSIIDDCVARGIGTERIVLLGFSQGACLSLTSAQRKPARYGGVIAYSGGLIGPPGTAWSETGSFAGTPAFFGCSDRDAHIPEERVRASAAVYERMGAEVTTRIYPGMGHLVNEDEIAFGAELLASITKS